MCVCVVCVLKCNFLKILLQEKDLRREELTAVILGFPTRENSSYLYQNVRLTQLYCKSVINAFCYNYTHTNQFLKLNKIVSHIHCN